MSSLTKLDIHRGLQLSGLGRLCPVYVPWVQAFVCTSVYPAVLYMPTGLAGCSVDPEISRGVHTLARTSQVIKKKTRYQKTIFFLMWLLDVSSISRKKKLEKLNWFVKYTRTNHADVSILTRYFWLKGYNGIINVLGYFLGGCFLVRLGVGCFQPHSWCVYPLSFF